MRKATYYTQHQGAIDVGVFWQRLKSSIIQML